MSRTARSSARRRRKRKLAQADEYFGPDRSRLVFAFADGWRIVQPSTVNDVTRCGHLLDNCLTHALINLDEQQVRPTFPTFRVLCDNDGYPRVAFHHLEGDSLELQGNLDHPLDPKHVERIRAWHRAEGLGDVLLDEDSLIPLGVAALLMLDEETVAP